MDYLRKFRPSEFSAVIGNAGSVKALKTHVEKEKDRPHCYLLDGPSGTGKTTLARIAAKALGASEDSIREMNVADTRGIDHARELIQEMRHLPLSGNCTVYIIDECHKATKDWQNAMLKPLEDTPEHIYFFLCTTEPQKLEKAIKTRLTRIELKACKAKDILSLLQDVCEKENLTIPESVLEDISENCEGSPRVALGKLQNVATLESEDDMLKVAKAKLDQDDQIIELARKIIPFRGSPKWKEIASLLKELKDSQIEPESIRRVCMGYASAILMNPRTNEPQKAYAMLEAFLEANTYDAGFPAITHACYLSLFGE